MTDSRMMVKKKASLMMNSTDAVEGRPDIESMANLKIEE